MQYIFDRGNEAPYGAEFKHLLLTTRVEPDLRADYYGQSGCRFDAEPQPTGRIRSLVQLVFQHKTFAVDVVRHQIQVAVVVEVDVGRTVGKARLIQAPGFRNVLECKRGGGIAAPVAVGVFGHTDFCQSVQLLAHLPELRLRSTKHAIFLAVSYKIEIGHVAAVAVGDVEIFPAIVIEISQQRSPTPVGFFDARQLTDFRKSHAPLRRTAIQLQGVAHELRLITQTHLHLKVVIVGAGEHHLLPVVIGREHVHHQDVGQRIVIDVGDVHAHAVVGLVLGERICLVSETFAPLVHPDKIIGQKIVGAVNVRPAVIVQVTQANAQAVAFGQDARL